MNKLIITRWNSRVLTALVSEKTTIELGLADTSSVLGNIYIGKVKKIVRNLNSAFVDFSDGCTGYYSLTDNKVTLFADGHERKLKEGDEIIVQVAKDAVKTKDPVLTGNLNFSGKYAVLTAGKQVIGFSSKIEDREWKEQMRPQIEALLEGKHTGIIIRTNAYGQETKLLRELSVLLELFERVINTARYRTCYTLLYESEPDYIKSLRNSPAGSLEEVVTDQPDLYARLQEYFRVSDISETTGLRFYEDHLLSLINLEAAKEIAHQLRLRNLSGIIMVDFIDMDTQEDKTLLMDTLKAAVRPDPVKTTVVDMTPLNLVEMTRKKEKRPLWEQIAQVQKKS